MFLKENQKPAQNQRQDEMGSIHARSPVAASEARLRGPEQAMHVEGGASSYLTRNHISAFNKLQPARWSITSRSAETGTSLIYHFHDFVGAAEDRGCLSELFSGLGLESLSFHTSLRFSGLLLQLQLGSLHLDHWISSQWALILPFWDGCVQILLEGE